MEKVQLVHCPDDFRTGMKEVLWYIPLNLLFLATYLRQNGIEAEILDGQLLSLDEICSRIDAPIVGASFTCISSHNLDKIARAAKAKGAEFIVGGQAATPLAGALLENNCDIDAVIMYEGEEAILSIARGNGFSNSPNTAHRTSGSIFIPGLKDIKPFPLRHAPIPDRSVPGADLEKHLALYREDAKRLGMPFKSVATAYTHRGCPKRAIGKACSFCSRIDIRLSCYTPEKAWKEYHYLAGLGIECVSDFSDDFVFGDWLRQYAGYCEKHGLPGSALKMYTCVEAITDENVALLKQIGVKTVLLGIESGDEDVLRQNGKYYSFEQIIKAATLLGKAGIYLADAYVLGMIGESKESLAKTKSVSEEIKKVCETEITYFNICTPLPGSRIWGMLMEDPELRKEFDSTYHLDPTRLEREFVKRFTSVPYDYMKEVRAGWVAAGKRVSTEYTKAEPV